MIVSPRSILTHYWSNFISDLGGGEINPILFLSLDVGFREGKAVKLD